MTNEENKLLSIKQLASELGTSRVYIWYMRKNGFVMPGNTATLAEARAWLVRNPPPCSRKKFRVVNTC